MRVVSGARGALKSEGLEAPFVGRDRELRQIKDLFHASADERRAHLVSVTGIAGIGKSRLAWEFYKYFDGLAQLIYWHRGRCLSYGEGVTYWALADMVRMRCRIAEDEPSEAALAKLSEVLDEHITDEDERRFVEPRVAHLIGLEEGSAFGREDLFAAWRLFFERLADAYPTVLVFEDMQWADASLLDFIEYLLDWSRQSPLFVVTAARPELLDRRPTWGAGKRSFTSLYLEPLSEDSMRALLEGLVPGLPDTLRGQILARAEGVPLYAVETVRMLLDRGLLVREGNVYRPAGPIEALEVPETLHALIAARLDGLSAEERRVVQDGAVLGKTFTREAVEALSGINPASVESVMAALVRKEVLSIQADPRSPEHGQYGFLQDLMRRVAYEMLSMRDRRERHLAAAAYLERTLADDDEIVEMLASHYIDAYTASPEADGAEAVRRRASELLVRAGERAESLGAPTEAQRYYTQAAGLSETPLAEAGLLDRAARMAPRAAAQDAAAELADRAHALYEAAGEHGSAARVLVVRSRIDQMQGRLAEALERMQQAHDVLRNEPPDESFANALNELFTSGVTDVLGDLVMIVGIIGVMLWMDPQLTLVTLLTIPLLWAATTWFRKGARRGYDMVRTRVARINAFLQEHFAGAQTVQIFNAEAKSLRRFAAINDDHRKANIDTIFYYAVFFPLVDFIGAVGIALIIWFGGYRVMNHALTLGALVAFIQYSGFLFQPIRDISDKYNVLQAAVVASHRIFKTLDLPIAVTSPEQPLKSGRARGRIEFQNVWFAYKDEDWVLKDVSFTVDFGQSVALVGHTGSGKTTITNLLMRFYDVQRGRILLDGTDIRDWELQSLRKNFAVVLQDVFLFSGTVEGNIRLGREDISEERVKWAASEVHADRFIQRLREGYKERG